MLDIEDPFHFFSDAQRQEAKSDPFRPLHRVAVFEDLHPDGRPGDALVPTIGAALRHELEHAKQQQCCREALEIDEHYLNQAVRLKTAGLPGGTDLFNFKPMEQDANAAAAAYLREHHAEHVDAIVKGPCTYLARSLTPPESRETLLTRTVACLFLFRDICEREWGSPIEFSQYLDMHDKRAGRLWRSLEAGGREDVPS